MTIHHHRSQQSAGFSLIELCICALILSTLLALAIPAMQGLVQKQRLQGIAQTLMTDLQEARSGAVQTGSAVHLNFAAHDGGSCYVVYAGSKNQCSCNSAGQAVCRDPASLLKLQWLPRHQAVSLQSNVPSMSFSPRQGGVTAAGTILLKSGSTMAIKQVVSLMGRIRSCSPNGSIGAMPSCPA